MVDPDHPLSGMVTRTPTITPTKNRPASDTPNPDIPVARGVNEAEGKEGGAVSTGESHTTDDTESFPASDVRSAAGVTNEGGETPSGGEPEGGKPGAEPLAPSP